MLHVALGMLYVAPCIGYRRLATKRLYGSAPHRADRCALQRGTGGRASHGRRSLCRCRQRVAHGKLRSALLPLREQSSGASVRRTYGLLYGLYVCGYGLARKVGTTAAFASIAFALSSLRLDVLPVSPDARSARAHAQS